MKKFFMFLLVIIAGFSITVKASDKLEYMDGLKKHTFSNKPYVVESTTDEKIFMIPIRETLEVLGFNVEWKEDGTIHVSKGMFKASLKVGSNEYKNRDGKVVNLYLSPEMIDGTTYVPHVFFYYVLGYDAFYVKDTLYIRYKIDGIVPQIISKYELIEDSKEHEENTDENDSNKEEDTKMTDIKPMRTSYAVYPVLTEDKYKFMNEEIMKFVSEIIDNEKYNDIYIKYDVGIFNEHILSIIFSGRANKNDKSYPIFESISFDIKNKKIITPDNFLNKSSHFRNEIKDDINEMIGDTKFSYTDLGFYFVKDAVIFYKNSGQYLPNKYVKLADLKGSIRNIYKDLFAN